MNQEYLTRNASIYINGFDVAKQCFLLYTEDTERIVMLTK